MLKDFLRTVRPKPEVQFERRFETPAGKQAQVDFAFFKTVFTDQPDVERIVWLFSIVLGHSRMMWARFVARQDLPTVLRCHIAAFEAFGGVPEQILYDRMKTAVLGEVEDPDQPAKGIAYNAKLLDLAAHYGFLPKACKPYRAKTKGKVERPFRYVREDFFLARTFRNLDDLNAQFVQWLDQVANVRLHATTQRVVVEHFAEERGHLRALPAGPFNTVLALERRITRDGMVSVAGNLYSVPDSTRRRTVEVQITAGAVNILEDGTLIASHPAQEGRGQRRIAPGHRTQPPPSNSRTTREEAKPARASRQHGDTPLAGHLRRHRPPSRQPAGCPMTSLDTAASPATLDRIRRHLVGLNMPRALEVIEHILRRIERGEISALEAIDTLLGEELTLREGRRVRSALKMGRLINIKTLSGFDFSFQPSLDRDRIMALAQLDFVDRHEAVHFLGQPGCGKTHLALALGVEAVKSGRSVYFATLADIVSSLAKAEREGTLRERLRFLCRPQLLIVDEIGYLPVISGGGNLFFQLVNARYERGAMILTSNRGFAEWGEVFGGTVVATALLDRLLHHAVVVQIEGASYRLRRHADLIPDNTRNRPINTSQPQPRRRGRPPKMTSTQTDTDL